MAEAKLPTDMEFPSNSFKRLEESSSKEEIPERRRVEKVVTSEVITKKKSAWRRFVETFVNEDASGVRNYIFYDVVVPAIKNTISDVVVNGIEMILFGDRRAATRSDRGKGSYVSYTNYYKSDIMDRRGSQSNSFRDRINIGDNIVKSRAEAEDIRSILVELTDKYGAATVADLYDLLGKTGYYTDNKYGWTDLRNARIVRVREGYLIDLPTPAYLD